jgi:sulfatase modifying factor 1
LDFLKKCFTFQDILKLPQMKNIGILIYLFLIVNHAFTQQDKDLMRIIEENMRLIPGGSFVMGNIDGYADELPLHQVTIDTFLLNKYEVTVKEFSRFITETGYITDAEKKDSAGIYLPDYAMRKGLNWRFDAEGNMRPPSEYDHPVIYVSWNDATAYCMWLNGKTDKNFRLPTEAEWEFAARCGDKGRTYSWGNFDPSGKRGGNIADESFKQKYDDKENWNGYNDNYVYTSPVGSFLPNCFGLYDMTGNVFEYCMDGYDTLYYEQCKKAGIVKNPSNMNSGFSIIVKGSSFINESNYLRISFRGSSSPNTSLSVWGFRIARDRVIGDQNPIINVKDPLNDSPDAIADGIVPPMVYIKGGSFLMGSLEGVGESYEHPEHYVFINDFYMGKYEITIAEYKMFIDASGYKTEVEKRGYSYNYGVNSFEEWKGVTWKHDEQGNRRHVSEYDLPVTNITWNDANAYCQWLSAKTGQEYHLPTEAEWEYAARCGSRGYNYSWGNDSPSGMNGGNICDESFAKVYDTPSSGYWHGYNDGYLLSAPVGKFNPNDFGLYDMTGNVVEWCWDWNSANYYEICQKNGETTNRVINNPRGTLSGEYKVMRGGSFNADPYRLRAARRGWGYPYYSFYFLGFRVARTK